MITIEVKMLRYALHDRSFIGFTYSLAFSK